MVDYSHFDSRNYPTLSVREGYGEWAEYRNHPVSFAMVWQKNPTGSE